MTTEPIDSTTEVEGYLKILSLIGYWPQSRCQSKYSRIFVIMQTAMVIFNVGFALKYFDTSLHNRESTFYVSWLIKLSYGTFTALTPLVSVFEILVNRKKLLKAEKSLIDLQRCLRMPLFEIDPFIRTCSILTLALMACMCVACLAAPNELYRGRVLFMEMIYLLNFFNIFVYAVRFLCLFTTVAKCFSRLTTSIENSSCHTYAKVKRIIRLQTKIKDICAELNDIFNVQMMLLLFYVFFAKTTQFRMWLFDYVSMFRNIEYATWTVFFSLAEMMIIHTGQKIINGANLFNDKFVNYLLHEEDENLIGKPIVLLYVTGNKNLALTACNFTTIDHKLGLTLCTACITYFIVLMQFGGPGVP